MRKIAQELTEDKRKYNKISLNSWKDVIVKYLQKNHEKDERNSNFYILENMELVDCLSINTINTKQVKVFVTPFLLTPEDGEESIEEGGISGRIMELEGKLENLRKREQEGDKKEKNPGHQCVENNR